MNSLKTNHEDMVNDYIRGTVDKTVQHYIITVSRDGESPARSIISFENIKEVYNFI